MLIYCYNVLLLFVMASFLKNPDCMILMIITIYYGILFKRIQMLCRYFRLHGQTPSKQHVLGPLGISGHDHASIDTFLAVLQPVLTWRLDVLQPSLFIIWFHEMTKNPRNVHIARHLSPIGSMNGISTCIYHKKSTINVGKHTSPMGWYGSYLIITYWSE